ncbi:MAG: transglutaminase family protein [Gammaproteobacteria bacterium]|nr:transglutaminase family protein [Gammaproteobacteria bacterium]
MTALYSIEHILNFDYTSPVQSSVMTLHVHPLRERCQVVRQFSLNTDPAGPLFEFNDPFGNTGHFFDRPGRHQRLTIIAKSTVEVEILDPAPNSQSHNGWQSLESWSMTNPSRFVHCPPVLEKFMDTHDLHPEDEPLTSVRELCRRLHQIFTYLPGSTQVDSPIEHILDTRQGVCQDYAHVMASILRHWGIPCRYVSGYLGPPEVGTVVGESHAWVECWFPDTGWLGFDPTNDTEGDERHIRVAVGRDYGDVPPARGVFRGQAESSLGASVSIQRHP